MHAHAMAPVNFAVFETIILLLGAGALLLYPSAIFLSNKKHRKWPYSRYIFWFSGISAATAALTGPLFEMSHENFTAHMAGHLLLGMLAPLLLVFSKPMTLLMRTLNVSAARRLSRVLNSRYGQFISNPLIASVLNIGGLYLIYKTDLFTMMHSSLWLFALVHLHVLLAGYLFTISVVYIDLTPHRYSFMYRSVILILALGFHKILSKLIYAEPPQSVSRQEGETGALLMYYGGDLIDFCLIIILCHQWYRASATKRDRSSQSYHIS
ncbi:cytochrome c oxidase assembly protein [Salinicoccus halodurans]|uniref:Membrane protein n=1 Tax=Salinicoccus halodurans TaxID=407035 RepID=A0A0F7D3T3_9STAP|nr:cytochrome c oxidase assembly protein [Salinicoccus halodurans]AKG73035.1 membrane protein [Salinicoccus halodurans]SFK77821.1 putative membrane protein [Salinicoccus halodurans]